MTFLDESEIELRVEKAIDKIDAKFMEGDLDEQEYDYWLSKIDQWAQAQYNNLSLGYRI